MLAFDQPLLWRQGCCFETFCNRMQTLLTSKIKDPQLIVDIAELEFKVWSTWQNQWSTCYPQTTETHLSLCFQAVTLHRHYRELLILKIEEAIAFLLPKKDPSLMKGLRHVIHLEKQLLLSLVHSQAKLIGLPSSYERDVAQELDSIDMLI